MIAKLCAICAKKNIIPNIKEIFRHTYANNQQIPPGGTPVFDEELYKRRLVIEHAFAWLDSFKALVIRYETRVRNWQTLHFMAFICLFLRKITKTVKV